MKASSIEFLLAFAAFVALAEPEPWGQAKGPGFSHDLSTRDSESAAMLTDSTLPAGTEEVYFLKPAESILPIGTIALTNRHIRFTAAEGVSLKTSGKESAFRLAGGDWTFDGISLVGPGTTEKVHSGIDCRGGSLTVTNCTFTKLGDQFSGGAICAQQMAGDVTISDCLFATNRCGTLNGTGGAIYVSGVSGGPVVTLTLFDCNFIGNSAQSGGAVTTVHTIDDGEANVVLRTYNCIFEKNTAALAGGAMMLDGECSFSEGSFIENTSALQGGALNICSSRGGNAKCLIETNVLFRENRVMDSTRWTCGGAIAIWGENSTLEVSGRYVVFEDNSALSGEYGYGGAVFAASGTVTRVSRAAFNGNTADDGGGALYVMGGDLAVTTSVFSNNTVVADDGYGGAVSADNGSLTMTNATIRFANRGAVSAYSTKTKLVNTVVVDNQTETDVEAYGDGATLTMEYVAYGTASASPEVTETMVTNACISGADEKIFIEETLILDTENENPVANNGLTQEATDYRDVEYGWLLGLNYSMGAYACPATPMPSDPPVFAISKVAWYHNRADGKYYPQVTIRYFGGEASLLETITLRCDDEDHDLPETCVAKLRTATTVGEEFVFGVDDAHWVASKNSSDDFGYIIGWKTEDEKRELMLFSVTDPLRSPVTIVKSAHPIEISSTPVAPMRLTVQPSLSVRQLPMTVTLPASFNDFRVGEEISGETTVSAGATVELWGTPVLGGDWRSLGNVALDSDGRFSCAVPDDVRFFKLTSEVSR